MKKRIIAAIAVIAILALALVACAKENYSFVNKAYIYESLIRDGSFTIEINEDGTYKYSVPSFNVYIFGTWTYENGILALKEATDIIGEVETQAEDEEETEGAYYLYNFRVDGDNLVYVAEGSSGFPFATIEDGALFINMGTK